MKLDERIERLIREKNWQNLNEIQIEAIENILAGKNVIIVAPTGYGKTEAALLPILHKMLNSQISPVTVLYITPLKALINDLTYRISWWASKLGFLVNRKHAEVPQKEKNLRLRRIPHILVTTPEGLEIDLDWASKFREYYKNVRWVIVDEVHDIISSKRGAQLLILLERLKVIAGDFQRIGLSATIGNVDKVAKLLFGSSLREGVIIKNKIGKNFDLKIFKVPNQGDIWRSSAAFIAQRIEPPTLIFTNSRFSTERLHEELEKEYGYSDGIYVHHSSISREIKDKVENSLRNGLAKVVICTKTLELGIDIGNINKVIMYRPPPTVSSFLQRLGRSGHSKESISRGEIVCVYDYEIWESLALYSLSIAGKLEEPNIIPYLDVVAREILGITLQYGRIKVEDIYNIITSSILYKELKFDEFNEIVKYLIKNNLLKINNNELSIGPLFFKIWRFKKDNKKGWSKGFSEFFSFIKNNETFYVKHNESIIGEIDAIYVYKHIRPGDIIRISGKLWKVSKIDSNKSTIDVIPSNEAEGEIPIWKGENISKSPYFIDEIERIFHNEDWDSNILDSSLSQTLESFFEYYKRNNLPLPSKKLLFVENPQEDEWVYSTLINEKVSNTLAHLLLYLATKEYGFNVYVKSSIYGFSIKGVRKNLLEEILKEDEKKIKELIIKAILRSPLLFATIKEIKYSFGKVGKVDFKEDNLIVKEALKQTISKYFSIKNTLNYIKLLKNGNIKIIQLNFLTRLGEIVISNAPIRPWIYDIFSTIYTHLKGSAYTLKELSEIIGITPKTLESKLKLMRKPGSPFRVVSFIDIETKENRWCLLEELEEIYSSEDYSSSFTPIKLDEVYIVVFRLPNDNTTSEIIVKVNEIYENPKEFRKRIPYDEIIEVRIKDPHDPIVYNMSPRYYYVNRNAIPYLILNAITYIQATKYL
ncbi:MAG: DEAD/DEAH box helicase [Sulfolobaceae archaeon]